MAINFTRIPGWRRPSDEDSAPFGDFMSAPTAGNRWGNTWNRPRYDRRMRINPWNRQKYDDGGVYMDGYDPRQRYDDGGVYMDGYDPRQRYDDGGVYMSGYDPRQRYDDGGVLVGNRTSVTGGNAYPPGYGGPQPYGPDALGPLPEKPIYYEGPNGSGIPGTGGYIPPEKPIYYEGPNGSGVPGTGGYIPNGPRLVSSGGNASPQVPITGTGQPRAGLTPPTGNNANPYGNKPIYYEGPNGSGIPGTGGYVPPTKPTFYEGPNGSGVPGTGGYVPPVYPQLKSSRYK